MVAGRGGNSATFPPNLLDKNGGEAFGNRLADHFIVGAVMYKYIPPLSEFHRAKMNIEG